MPPPQEAQAAAVVGTVGGKRKSAREPCARELSPVVPAGGKRQKKRANPAGARAALLPK